ncbi:MAG: DNA-binding transcriptional regulator [Acidobacteria bacterium]|nr:DNA-binding transcriptional regulator [Acidobacteriota bacterium]
MCGVAAYIRENRPWSVYFSERSVYDPVPEWLKHWSGDGIISRIASPEIREVVARTHVPVVDLNGQLGDLGVPLISNDHAAIGRMAAAHLMERGFTRFGYVGHSGTYWSERRGQEFMQTVRAAGYECVEYQGTVEDIGSLRQASWELEIDVVAAWVAGLRKPVGILAGHDFRALQLLAACRLAGVAVPEQAAVIGVGADDVACELADPPLSSVILNAWRMGYEAAALLDRLMRKEPPPRHEVLIPPLDVASRQSTGTTAIGDPVVAKAVSFIREHACDGINVEDVLAHLVISRTALQDRFRKGLRRSIHDVVVEARIARVKELLAQTTLSLAEIAERTGFNYPEYMSTILKQRTGWTPARYRQEYGPKTPPPIQLALPEFAAGLTDARSAGGRR